MFILLFGILFLLPVLSIFVSSLSKVQGVFSFSNLTLENFRHLIFEMPEFLISVKNSLYLSVSVASVSVIVGFILSYVEVRTSIFGRSLVRAIPTYHFQPQEQCCIGDFTLFWKKDGKYKFV